MRRNWLLDEASLEPLRAAAVATSCTVLAPEEWDDSKHGKGTKVVRKSDGRTGVSTMDHSEYGTIKIRFDDGGNQSDRIKTYNVWAAES